MFSLLLFRLILAPKKKPPAKNLCKWLILKSGPSWAWTGPTVKKLSGGQF